MLHFILIKNYARDCLFFFFFKIGVDPNRGRVIELADRHFRVFDYQRKTFLTLVAAGLDVRAPLFLKMAVS